MRFVIARRYSLAVADGISAFVHSLSTALMDAGHEVYLLASCDTSDEKIRKNFGHSSYTKLFNLLDAKDPTDAEVLKAWRGSVPSILRSVDPDFVIMNGVLPMRLRYPSCAVSHDLEPHAYNAFLRRLLKMFAYRLHGRVVVTCSELRPMLAKELRLPEPSIAVIPTCIDLSRYSNDPLERREAAVLHMGMVGSKRPLATIEAFAKLTQPATLYMTGFPGDDVQQAIAALPSAVQTRIHLLGVVDNAELRRLLGTVRVLVVPSYYLLPVASPTALDGLASGTPIVASTSISVDLIADGENGFAIPHGHTGEIAKKIDSLLRDDVRWRAMSAAASGRAMRFDHTQVARQYVDLAQAVIAAGRGRGKSTGQGRS